MHDPEIRQQAQKYAAHLAGLVQTSCMMVGFGDIDSDSFCTDVCRGCNSVDAHSYGCSEAYRWGGRYIYYCPFGLVFAASSLSEEYGSLAGGLVCGPMIMGDLQDTLSDFPSPECIEVVANLPAVSTEKVRHLAEIMAVVTSSISGHPHGRAGALIYEQEKILSALYETKTRLGGEAPTSKSLIEGEKQLRDRIISKDKSGAQELLNELLGTIYFSHNFNLDHIKARIIELIVLLSRASIDAGADISEILLSNTGYIKELERFTSLEELSVWVTGIMHRFVKYTFDFSQIRHSNVVYKVMEYIRNHYDEKITLDDIAQYVYLSRAYLSSVFAEETGQSLFSYINYYRVEKSKMLLRDMSVRVVDVAGLCGYDDQSYFTKVFRKQTGMSPKKYRDSHRELQTH